MNYLYLSRKKMLWLLLFTVPALAFTTSASARLLDRRPWLCDQIADSQPDRARPAKSHSRDNGPPRALRRSQSFGRDAVFARNGRLSGDPDDQRPGERLRRLVGDSEPDVGLAAARTRTQFFTVRNAEQRSRVELKKTAGKTEFSNGLPWELEMVVASDESGHFYVGRSVAPGATVALAEPTTDDLADFVALLNRNAPALPVGFVEPTPSAFRGGLRLDGLHDARQRDDGLFRKSDGRSHRPLANRSAAQKGARPAVLRRRAAAEPGCGNRRHRDDRRNEPASVERIFLKRLDSRNCLDFKTHSIPR